MEPANLAQLDNTQLIKEDVLQRLFHAVQDKEESLTQDVKLAQCIQD